MNYGGFRVFLGSWTLKGLDCEGARSKNEDDAAPFFAEFMLAGRKIVEREWNTKERSGAASVGNLSACIITAAGDPHTD